MRPVGYSIRTFSVSSQWIGRDVMKPLQLTSCAAAGMCCGVNQNRRSHGNAWGFFDVALQDGRIEAEVVKGLPEPTAFVRMLTG